MHKSIRGSHFINLALSGLIIAHPTPAFGIFSVVLAPSGDAKHTGRELDDGFERGVTLQFAKQVKAELDSRLGNIRVVLSRFPGETVEPEQNASFSNRLGSDLFLAITFYRSTEQRPQLDIYHYVRDPTTDFWEKKLNMGAPYPHNIAHIPNVKSSNLAAKKIQNLFKKPIYRSIFDTRGIIAFPCKQLVGITAPIALMLEWSLDKSEGWTRYVPAMAEAIVELYNQYPALVGQNGTR